MMTNANRFFLVVTTGLLLLVCPAMRAYAQEKPPPATPLPTPAEVIKLDRRVDDSKLVFRNSITGQIRWKKELGLPIYPEGGIGSASYPCGKFQVRATVVRGEPGTFGSDTEIGNFNIQNPRFDAMSEDGDYYVCAYSVTDLPLNQMITVSARFSWEKHHAPSSEYGISLSTTPWDTYPGWLPSKPPPDYQRIITGRRGVTLTDAESHAVVNFEVVYGPIPVIR